MRHAGTIIVAALMLASFSTALADTYPPSAGRCVILSHTLYIGTTDATTAGDVSALQQFLGISPTGYFGPITQAALQNWQAQNGIISYGTSATTGYGMAGPRTRALLGCRTNPGLPPSSYGSPSLQFVSPTSGIVGNTVTLYGSRFSTGQNIILFDGTAVANFASANGTTLSFTLPSNYVQNCSVNICTGNGGVITQGTHTVTVSNENGTSNGIQFYFGGSVSGNTGTPSLQSISPSSGSVGTTVTIYGSGFGTLNQSNTILFNNVPVATLASANGTTLVFSISSASTANANSTYTVTVSNQYGTSNGLSFTVTPSGTSSYAPVLQSLSPTSGTTGTLVTIYGSGFAAGNNYVRYRPSTNIYGQQLDGQVLATYINSGTLTFIVPSSMPYGTNLISVQNDHGVSNSYSFTVSSSGTAGTPSISSISPSPVPSGSFATVSGNNFTNVIEADIYNSSNQLLARFSNGNLYQLYQWNGSTQLQFVVPSSLSSDTYYLRIVTSSGTSASFSFSVTNGYYGTSPAISSLSSSSAYPGQTVTIYGSNFDANSYVSLGNVPSGSNAVTVGANSYTNTSLTFTVPYSMGTGTFSVYVAERGGGAVSNSSSLTIYPSAQQASPPVIQYLSPSSGPVGTYVVARGSGFASSNTVLFDGQTIANAGTSDATTLYFTVPAYYPPDCSQSYCTNTYRPIGAGTHTVSIANANGTTNGAQFTVTGNF